MVKKTIDRVEFIKIKNLDSTEDTVKDRLGENIGSMYI